MRQKSNTIFRRTGAVVFGAVLAASSAAFASAGLIAQEPTEAEGVQAEQGTPAQEIKPKTENLLFAGFASLSSEDKARAIKDRSFETLFQAGARLEDADMVDDAKALFKQALYANYSDDDFLQALTQYVEITVSSPLEDEIKYADVDEIIEEAIALRPNSWRVKTRIANMLVVLPPAGYMQDGKFVYTSGYHENRLFCQERVRIRKMRLYADALPFVREELDQIGYAGEEAAHAAMSTRFRARQYYYSFAQLFQVDNSRAYRRQQILTDLDVLPDYVPADDFFRTIGPPGAPVDEEGAPVFFTAPESFEAAKNDGERRQALLNEMIERFPEHKASAYAQRAAEAQAVFGVHTLAPYFASSNGGQALFQETVQALKTLADNETIALLENGVKRFELPPDYDFINLWRQTLNLNPSQDPFPLTSLAQEYQNRGQLDKAASCWKQLLEIDNISEYSERIAQASLAQIANPLVAIDSSSSVVGMKADLYIRYRNAVSAEIVVKRLNINDVLKIVCSDQFWQEHRALRNVQSALDLLLRQQFAPEENETATQLNSDETKLLEAFKDVELIGETVVHYTLPLEPDPNHNDKIARLDFAVYEPGAYLVEITAADGNKDAAVMQLHDVAVIRKPFEDGCRYFALDAESGEPLADQRIRLFIVDRYGNEPSSPIMTKTYTKRTDQSGSILFPKTELYPGTSCEFLAFVLQDGDDASNAGQIPFMDFHRMGSVDDVDDRNDFIRHTRGFFVSDRPVYRPGQKAEFKFIVGTPYYEAPEESQWAGQNADYQIVAPDRAIVVQKRIQFDEFGAFSDSFEIPADANPGVYAIQLAPNLEFNRGSDFWLGEGSFQIAGAPKPEFQVAINAPKEPVALGEPFKASIVAKDELGAPVANAVVSYKVTRTNYRYAYFPARFWDWHYGSGYWNFAYDHQWYPGWNEWGCRKLESYDGPQTFGASETVVSGEAQTGEDGVVEISVDTASAKRLLPDVDHLYEITAETTVGDTDESRRAIVGVGKVVAAHKPFQTYVWLDRGYYCVGDMMTFGFEARRPDGKGVPGDAVVALYKVEYEKADDGSLKPIEFDYSARTLKTDDEGKGIVEIPACDPGQYRVSCVVTSEEGVQQEGGQLVVVRGDGTELEILDQAYNFNPLEIVPDKPEYSVGDVAHIQIASSNLDAYVFFAVKSRGELAFGDPRVIKLQNGMAYVDVPIESGDMPKLFVQATTVFDGRICSEQKALAVPPKERIVKIAVEPRAQRVKPGAKASITLRLADVDGKPAVGQTTVAIYDKSLDDVPGKRDVADVRELFWKKDRFAQLKFADNLSQGALINVFDLVSQSPFLPQVRTQSQNRPNPIGILGNQLVGVLTSAMEIQEMSSEGARAPETAEVGAQFLSEAPEREDLAYWAANLTPNADGVVEIEVVMPETSATWKIAAWSVGPGLCVGSGEAEIVTSDDVADAEKP